MNRLTGTIKKVQRAGAINRIVTDCNGVAFTCVTLDRADRFREGMPVAVVFKETEVALAKGEELAISISNTLFSHVESVEEGVLLSEVTLSFDGMRFVSIITTDSLKRLEIKTGDAVTALIKANEISIEEVSR